MSGPGARVSSHLVSTVLKSVKVFEHVFKLHGVAPVAHFFQADILSKYPKNLANRNIFYNSATYLKHFRF